MNIFPEVRMSVDAERVKEILSDVPARYRGPGGAIAVLEAGKVVGKHVWGYADLDRREPMTSKVLLPMCSITKQFFSSLIHSLSQEPPPGMSKEGGSFHEQMNARLRQTLTPSFVDEDHLTLEDLISNSSGLRDYWALCTIQGSRPESPYSLAEHNPDQLRKLKTLHFAPGSEYSYSNMNFNVAERLLEHVTQDSFANLLQERILGPAGMTTARLCPRTDRFPAPIVGYEGTEETGFFAAPNFIEWSADAGLVASLDDMIAYETWFDKMWTEDHNGYRSTVMPRPYKNGAKSYYRYGLSFRDIAGMAAMGHGGALRGFKLYRTYLESKRLSVVVLCNHHAKVHECASYIVKQILGIQDPPAPAAFEPSKDWFGCYLDAETQLAVRISPDTEGKINLLYARATESLRLRDAEHAESDFMEASISGDSIRVYRKDDNRVLNAQRLVPKNARDRLPVQGRYYCNETESTFQVEGEGDMLYGMFDGTFGRGPPHLMKYLGSDVWVLADPRAMDDTPPGDWTVVFNRDKDGAVENVTIGCWLARKLSFARVMNA